MKAVSYSIIVVMLLAVMLYAQPAKFGITVAGNSTNWHGTDAKSFASNVEREMLEFENFSGNFRSAARLAFSIGAFCDVPLTPMIHLQPEVNYVQRGSKLTGIMSIDMRDYYWGGETYDIHTDLVFKCDYLELPLLFKLCSKARGDRFSLYAGPVYSLLMSSKVMVKVSLEGESEQETVDFPAFESNDVGFIIGAAAEMSGGIILGARYYHGSGALSSGAEMYNKALTVYLGTAF